MSGPSLLSAAGSSLLRRGLRPRGLFYQCRYPPPRELRSGASRWLQSQSNNAVVDPEVEAVVVGGGPGGIATVGNLFENLPGKRPQLWVDPQFGAGRVGDKYREVPSNTKVSLFLQFATATEAFRHIVNSTAQPNAVTKLQQLPQDQGCQLGHAADVCSMLTEGLSTHYSDKAQQHRGRVTSAVLDEQTQSWTVTLDNEKAVTAARLVLCTGSSPISAPLPVVQKLSNEPAPGRGITPLHLDIALKPSLLAKTLDPSAETTVGVIGASHSAILVLMNLYKLASTTHRNLRIKWFTRHKNLRYAKYMDGWILYDNTGLKGQAAEWARESLEEETFPGSPVSEVITKFWTPLENGAEEAIYKSELPTCTHVVQAIGYNQNPLPKLSVTKDAGATTEDLTLQYDNLTGRFFGQNASKASGQATRRYVPNLFGAGIAFPELMTDPAGNKEYAVGFWKFMRFLKRVVPEWVNKP